MAETVTFLSSDEPPVEFVVPRLALSTSVVFQTMVEDASKTAEPVRLDDKGSELKLFFDTLQSRAPKAEDKVEDEDWLGLARLADKYECEMVKTTVQVHMWRLIATKKQPLLAFTLASILIDRPALREAALPAVVAGAPYTLPPTFGASREVKEALSGYLGQIQLAACRTIVLARIEPSACGTADCTPSSFLQQWHNCMRKSMSTFHFNPMRPFYGSFGRVQPVDPDEPEDFYQEDDDEMGFVALCNEHREVLLREVSDLERRFVAHFIPPFKGY
ncbi:hypothetical protein JCM6882_002076 [Rhodosporidiobolus microsporus]